MNILRVQMLEIVSEKRYARATQIAELDVKMSVIKALYSASENGQVALLEQLLEDLKGQTQEKAQEAWFIKGYEALCIAAENGHLTAVSRLLQIPEIRALAHTEQNRALEGAIRKGHLDVVERLLTIPEILALVRQRLEGLFYEVVKGTAAGALLCALESGSSAMTERLLQFPEVRKDASIHANWALCRAAFWNRLAVLEQLLAIPEVFKYAHEGRNRALREAAMGGYLDVVARLLQIPQVLRVAELAWNDSDDFTLRERGRLDEARRQMPQVPQNADLAWNAGIRQLDLEGNPAANEEAFEDFQEAAAQGDLEKIKELLHIPAIRAHAHAEENQAFRSAVLFGHLEIVKLLLEIKAVWEEAHAKENEALRIAVANGAIMSLEKQRRAQGASGRQNETLLSVEKATRDQLTLVSLLLENPKIREHAAVKENAALRLAASQGSGDMVRLLLQIPQVQKEAHAKENEALRIAVANGALASLVKQRRAQVESGRQNETLLSVEKASRDQLTLVSLLLENPKILECAAVRENAALRLAASQGNGDMVRLLLQIPQVQKEAHARENEALRRAVHSGHTDVVRLLLQISKVQGEAHARGNEALGSAIFFGNLDIARMLLEIPSVAEGVHERDNAFLREVLCKKQEDLVASILAAETTRGLLEISSVAEEARTKEEGHLRQALYEKQEQLVGSLLAEESVRSALGTLKDHSVVKAVVHKQMRFLLSCYPLWKPKMTSDKVTLDKDLVLQVGCSIRVAPYFNRAKNEKYLAKQFWRMNTLSNKQPDLKGVKRPLEESALKRDGPKKPRLI